MRDGALAEWWMGQRLWSSSPSPSSTASWSARSAADSLNERGSEAHDAVRAEDECGGCAGRDDDVNRLAIHLGREILATRA